MRLGGELLDVRKVTTPAFFQAAREDHIAPAASVYSGARLFSGRVTYMLAGSGHIAGVINPPAAEKYQHWTNDALPATLDLWRAGATEHPGSWWPYWDASWLAPRSGDLVQARVPGDQSLRVLGDAPGSYVFTQTGGLNTQPKTRKRKAA